MDLVGMFGTIGGWAVLCFIVGLLLVIFEMHIPGFGVPGITGAVLLVSGVFLTARNVVEGLFLVLLIVVILGICLTFVLHSATKGKLAKTLVLKEALNKENGFSGTEDLSYFLGKKGVALTVLRPAGMADFDGVKLDVVADGDYLTKGARIEIVKVEGRRIIVHEIKADKKF